MQDDKPLTASENNPTERRATELRAAISDLGHELDARRTKKAAAMGGGVFLGLLAVIAANDLTHGKAGLWLAIGISDSQLMILAIVFGIAALLLLGYGIRQQLQRDHSREQELEALMQELEDLLARQDMLKS
jgi:hypothetical protein